MFLPSNFKRREEWVNESHSKVIILWSCFQEWEDKQVIPLLLFLSPSFVMIIILFQCFVTSPPTISPANDAFPLFYILSIHFSSLFPCLMYHICFRQLNIKEDEKMNRMMILMITILIISSPSSSFFSCPFLSVFWDLMCQISSWITHFFSSPQIPAAR